MLKAQTILCITLAVIVGRAVGQLDDDFGFDVAVRGGKADAVPAPRDNLTVSVDPGVRVDLSTVSALPALIVPEPKPLGPAPPVTADSPLAALGLAAYLPSLEDLEQGIRQVIQERQDALLRNYQATVKKAQELADAMDVKGASWQLREQTMIMEDYQRLSQSYQKAKNNASGKDFSRCDGILKKVVVFLNSMGSNFYSCHFYYNNASLIPAKKIFAIKEAEKIKLKELLGYDCGVAKAKDTKSKGESFKCLLALVMEYLNRPNADPGLEFISTTEEFLAADQDRYLHSCPAYAQWHLYVQMKSQFVTAVRQCIREVMTTP